MGTAAVKLPRVSFPNAYPGASPAFAPHTTFDASGNVTGGFGVENIVTANAHSTYHALQTSLSGTVGHGGPGIQASYTWSKSIDDTSGVISGSTPQNPFDTHAEKGPSSFDVTHGFGLSAAQDLHLESVGFLRPVSKKLTDGWELLSISGISSGSPFTVFSGIQQTGAGSNGVDRPDQIATAASVHRAQEPPRLLWRGRKQRHRLSSPFPSTSPAAQDPIRADSARWGATPFAARPFITSISPSSRTRPSAAARAEPNA